MSMEDLVAAGAPELPDGWFYRIRESVHVGYKLEIREQQRFTSRLMASSWVLEERHDEMVSAVVAACRRAYDQIQERGKQKEKLAALAAMAGDHDPKGGRT